MNADAEARKRKVSAHTEFLNIHLSGGSKEATDTS
jgi:hypothetical protein